jgi:ATP synthase protein I
MVNAPEPDGAGPDETGPDETGPDETSSRNLRELGARLEEARRSQNEGQARKPALGLESRQYGQAWRLAVEMVAGLAVGAGMGWLLDWFFGTSPWLMVIFFFLGAGAGMKSAMRVAREINRPENT